MPLEWSEPCEPTEGCRYDHVVCVTPLGAIRLEWKSWKAYDSPTGEMPWGEFIIGHSLEEAKAEAQAAWDRVIPQLLRLCSDKP